MLILRATTALACVETSTEISDDMIAEAAQDVAVDTSNNVARGTANKIAAGFANVTSSSSGAAAEEIEDEDAEIDAVETVSECRRLLAAEVNSADESTASGAFSGGEGMVAEASTEEDVVSMDELEAAEASFDDVPSCICHPSTRQYVRRARRGSLVSTDSERTASVTVRQLFQESETAPAAVGEVPGSEEVSVHIPEVPEEVAASEEPVQADVTPGSGVPSYRRGIGPGTLTADMEVTAPVAAHTSPTKTAGSGSETIAEEERRLQTAAMESAIRGQPGLLSAARSATLGSSVLADMDAFFREFDRTSFSSRHAEHFWTFDDVKANFEIFRVPRGGIRFLKALWEKLEDITKVHILEWKAVVQEAIEGGFKFGFILDYLRRLAHDMFSRRILAELRVAEARVAALRMLWTWVCQGSSIRLRQPVVTTSMCFSDDVWSIPIGRELGWRCGNEAVAEGERRHQTAAVESASRGQLGLLSVAKSATLGSSVLAEMDAFFREFDRMLVSSRHAEYFWIFDDVKVEFHGFRVPQGGVRFLEALWKKYGSCSAYLKLGVYIKGFMLTLLCLKRIVAGVTAAAYGVVAEAADDVVVKVADEVIAEIVENASNMQEVPAVNDVIVLGIIPKQDSQNRRGDSPQDRDYDPGRSAMSDIVTKLLPAHSGSAASSVSVPAAGLLVVPLGLDHLEVVVAGFCALTADSAWECSMWAETSLCFLLCRGLGGMALELYLSSWKC
uniref:Uncharacterized protein n=1 Tax=Fagus sylvatica TaxID=28930 RepID=A0A2N9FH00_FAGSY